VHLELVSDLTTEAYLAVLRRFMSRRGKCQTLHCDNATNFFGARNKLQELEEAIFSEKAKRSIVETCNNKGVNFKFIPPRAPHFGGLWGAAVTSAKHLLLKNVSTDLTFEELETVIVEIEAIMNSRPLVPISTDPNDVTALTTGHFLIGEPLTAQADGEPSQQPQSLGQRWQAVSKLKHAFWTQWSTDYLQQLQHRQKWRRSSANVKEGELVLIKEDNTPVLQWPLGRINKTIVFFVRVVEVKTSKGIFKRDIEYIAPIFSEEEPVHKHPAAEEEDENSPDERQTKRSKKSAMPSLTMALVVMILLLPLVAAQSINVT